MRILLGLVVLFNTLSVWGQDSLAGYQKSALLPTFQLHKSDSSWIKSTELAKDKATLILYFSPDCGHCQIETEEVLSKMRDLANLQIIMVTSRPYQDMVAFAEHYKLNRFSQITVGQDPNRIVSTFYDVRFTPFSALYDKQGKLVTVYKEGINMNELIQFLHK